MRTADGIESVQRPEDLFAGDGEEVRRQFRTLALRWHPDRNRGDARAGRVFAHISRLYEEVVGRIRDGSWEGEGVLRLTDKRTGGFHEVAYLRQRPFELGRTYVERDCVTYVVDGAHGGLFDNALSILRGLEYANDAMRRECARYVPVEFRAFETPDGRRVLRVAKDAGMLLLRDVLAYYGGSLNPRHAAWILSSLESLACYLAYAGIVHHDISPDTYFVSPARHTGALLGGWWYGAPAGGAISLVPRRTYECLPWEARVHKVALPLTDQELIRATGRELMGDVAGVAPAHGSAPAPLAEWARGVAGAEGVEAYREWNEVVTRSFGRRRFVPMALDEGSCYSGKRSL